MPTRACGAVRGERHLAAAVSRYVLSVSPDSLCLELVQTVWHVSCVSCPQQGPVPDIAKQLGTDWCAACGGGLLCGGVAVLQRRMSIVRFANAEAAEEFKTVVEQHKPSE